MLKFALATGALFALSACGTAIGDRAASGAAIGGGAGLALGGVGAIPGAIIGAGVGALTPPDKVNLGEPVWDDATDNRYDENGNPQPRPQTK
jgi:osmotically inducible lipoprotein OsmB